MTEEETTALDSVAAGDSEYEYVTGFTTDEAGALAAYYAIVADIEAVHVGPDLAVRHVHAEASVAAGSARINGGAVALLAASLAADGTHDRMMLNAARIVVRGRPDSAPTTVGPSGGLVADTGASASRGALFSGFPADARTS